ncbi:Site-specific recombinase XerD [Bacteroides thetaiotaomicron]|uniref:tyrosine-type recombinase/integrase n=1 Tax=Bacteroides thetaiotaomicron TaxID=818 RepID=UPI00089FD735|nr:site-specific integrase [Bacteroides thetaiotaomicron]MBS5448612.1 site-specific integrase [Bacteroides thetaiotaomicron]SEF40243.1 Site-specific recombinase XerD [Bacteroides thetaiotaomicron]
MASVKVKLRPSTVNGREGTLYYQIIHNRVVRQINTEYKLFVSEWDCHSETVVLHHLSPEQERNNYLLSISSRIRWDKDRLNKIIHTLSQSGRFVTDDIVVRFRGGRQEQSFNDYICQQIARLKRFGKIRTSETYMAALRSFSGFMNDKEVLFDLINANLIAEYEAYLKGRGNSPNTVSFYMRILKAVYNRAVEDGLTEQRYPFKSVYTGVEKTMKRALSLNDIRRIKGLDLSLKPNLDYACDMFLFCFYTRGMSFIDMAYLRKKDLLNGTLSYRRRKTGQQLFIKWEKCMQEIVDKYPINETEYLLPIITKHDEDYRKQYTNELHRVNHLLKKIGKLLDLPIPLTMYVGRHSWASIAKSRNVPVSVISEGMGHDSENTTQIYLASLDTSVVDKANKKILDLL